MPGYALIFPGQGSQYVGMGRDLYVSSPAARAVFDAADRALQGELRPLLFEGPAEKLTDTVNAQPAMYVMSMACWAALCEALPGSPAGQPDYTAGHSLGEYAALSVAGAFSFGTGLDLVRARGQAMKQAGQASPGSMAAILGLDAEAVQRICEEAAGRTGEAVVLANDNAPGQIVVSGTRQAVQAATEIAKGRGAKRVIPLAVSIASHSPLMQPAVVQFRSALREAAVQAPRIPVVANRDARPVASAQAVLDELEGQLISPVRWTDTVCYVASQGVTTFVEVGPKDVLTGLVKRIAPNVTCIPCGSVSGVAQAAQALQGLATQS